MALKKNTNGSNTSFLTVVKGRLARRVPEGTEGAESRELENGPNKGSIIFEEFFSEVSGYLIGNGLVETPYGDMIEIALKDPNEDESYQIRIPWDSRIRDQFVRRIPEIDVEKPLEIICFPDKKDQTPVLLVKQGGENLKTHFTRENPGECPSAEKKIDKKGKETWSFEERDAYLWKLTEEFFDKFKSDEKPKYQEAVEDDPEPEEEEESSDKADDSVPF